MHFFQSGVYAAVGMNHIIAVLDDDSSNQMDVTNLNINNSSSVQQEAVKKFSNKSTGTSFLNPEIH